MIECRNCGHKFTLNDGGGLVCLQLRCDSCGRPKSIYIKDSDVLRKAALPDKEYCNEVEKSAGACPCGGKYTFDAPPRCPKCRSTDIDKGNIIVMYD